MVTQQPTEPASAQVAGLSSESPHPYDYYYREGMTLRPPPSRAVPSPLWLPTRRAMLSPWLEVRETPVSTPRSRLMADHLWQGDEPMDAVVAAFGRVGGAAGRKMLDRALAHGIETVPEAPAELVALFERLDTPPSWYDARIWERGRRLWINASTAGKLAMVTQDFMGTFVGAEVASATGATARYLRDPYRRNLETTNWFRTMTESEALDRWSRTFQDTVRVRLMHSQVRAGLRKSWGTAHFAANGNPISNATMMGAAVTFGLTPLCFDHANGRRARTEDLDAVMHYWAYIAHVFGVTEELIPRTALEGMQMVDFMGGTAGVAPEWTEKLARAATASFGGERRRDRIAVLATAPALGAMAALSSPELVRQLLRGTSLQDVPLRPWLGIATRIARLEVRLRALTDRLPLREARLARRACRDDPVWRWQAWLARRSAAKAGVYGTPYDQHDGSASGQVSRRPAR